jgi:F0F1-type ATP synthase membrane subunit a
VLILVPAARRIAKNPYAKPTRFTGFIEVLVNFIRNDVAHASLGHHAHPYEPYLLDALLSLYLSRTCWV